MRIRTRPIEHSATLAVGGTFPGAFHDDREGAPSRRVFSDHVVGGEVGVAGGGTAIVVCVVVLAIAVAIAATATAASGRDGGGGGGAASSGVGDAVVIVVTVIVIAHGIASDLSQHLQQLLHYPWMDLTAISYRKEGVVLT